MEIERNRKKDKFRTMKFINSKSKYEQFKSADRMRKVKLPPLASTPDSTFEKRLLVQSRL